MEWQSFVVGLLSGAALAIVIGFLRAAGNDLYQYVKRKLGRAGVEKPQIAAFIKEGQELRERADDDPLPIGRHNTWVAKMNSYFSQRGADDLTTRLSDFSGLTLYSGSGERGKYLNSIDGRSMRLHEFLREID